MLANRCCSFKNPRTSAIVFGSFAIIQFSVETLFLLCFAVYAATPISIVTKVFYAFAAIAAPFLLVLSALFVYSVSQSEHRWTVPWLVAFSLVVAAELIFTVIGFILINDLHEIFQFYNIAWDLAQLQMNNQLLIGTTASCAPVPSLSLPSSTDGVRFAAMFSQQGAQGVIAFFVLALLLKNVFNFVALAAGVQAYREIKDGGGKRTVEKEVTPRRSHSYYDPYGRADGARRERKPFSSVNTVAR